MLFRSAEALASAARRALERGRRTCDSGLALDGYRRVASEVARIVPVKQALVPVPGALRELSA